MYKKRIGCLVLAAMVALLVMLSATAVAEVVNFGDYFSIKSDQYFDETKQKYIGGEYYNGSLGSMWEYYCGWVNQEADVSVGDVSWSCTNSADGSVAFRVEGGQLYMNVLAASPNLAGATLTGSWGGNTTCTLDLSTVYTMPGPQSWPTRITATPSASTVAVNQDFTISVGEVGGHLITPWSCRLQYRVHDETDSTDYLDYAYSMDYASVDTDMGVDFHKPGTFDLRYKIYQGCNVELYSEPAVITFTSPAGYENLADMYDIWDDGMANFASVGDLDANHDGMIFQINRNNDWSPSLYDVTWTAGCGDPEVMDVYIDIHNDYHAELMGRLTSFITSDDVDVWLDAVYTDENGVEHTCRQYATVTVRDERLQNLAGCIIIDQSTLTDGAVWANWNEGVRFPNVMPSSPQGSNLPDGMGYKIEVFDPETEEWRSDYFPESDYAPVNDYFVYIMSDSIPEQFICRYEFYFYRNLRWTTDAFPVYVGQQHGEYDFDQLFTYTTVCDDTQWYYDTVVGEHNAYNTFGTVTANASSPLSYDISDVRFTANQLGNDADAWAKRDEGDVNVYFQPWGTSDNAGFRISATLDGRVYTKEITGIQIHEFDGSAVPASLEFGNDGRILASVNEPIDLTQHYAFQPDGSAPEGWQLKIYDGNQWLIDPANQVISYDQAGVYHGEVTYRKYNSLWVTGSFTAYVDVEPGSLDEFFHFEGNVPDVLYVGDNTYSLEFQVWPNEGYGMYGFNAWIENGHGSMESRLEYDENAGVNYGYVKFEPYDVGTVLICLEANYDGNQCSKELRFDVERVPSDLPQLTIDNLQHIIVNNVDKYYYVVDANTDFSLPSFTLTGGTQDMRDGFESAVWMDPENAYGYQHFTRTDGDPAAYRIDEKGVYPFTLKCGYSNIELHRSFYIAVKDGTGDYGQEDFNSWFDVNIYGQNEDNQYYYSPEHGVDIDYGWLCAVPAVPDDVRNSFDAEIVRSSSSQAASATAELRGSAADGYNIYVNCNPDGTAGVDAFDIDFSWIDEYGVLQNHVETFTVNMKQLEAAVPDALHAEDMNIPTAVPGVDQFFDLSWTPDSASFPDGARLDLYHEGDISRTDHWHWGDFSEMLRGSSGSWRPEADTQHMPWYMSFEATWNNLEWDADFVIYYCIEPTDVGVLPYNFNFWDGDVYLAHEGDYGGTVDEWAPMCWIDGDMVDGYSITSAELAWVSGANENAAYRVTTMGDDSYKKFTGEVGFVETGLTVLEFRVEVNGQIYTRTLNVQVVDLPSTLPTDFQLSENSIIINRDEWCPLPAILSYTPDGSVLPEGRSTDYEFWVDGVDWYGNWDEGYGLADSGFRFALPGYVEPGRYEGVYCVRMGLTCSMIKHFTINVTDDNGAVPEITIELNPSYYDVGFPVLPNADSLQYVGRIFGDARVMEGEELRWTITDNGSTGVATELLLRDFEGPYDDGFFFTNVACMFPTQAGHMSYTIRCDLVDTANEDAILATKEVPFEFELMDQQPENDWHFEGQTEYRANNDGTIHLDCLTLVGTDLPTPEQISHALNSAMEYEYDGEWYGWRYTNGTDAYDGIDLELYTTEPGAYTFGLEAWYDDCQRAYGVYRVILGDAEEPNVQITTTESFPLVLEQNSEYHMFYHYFQASAAEGDTMVWTLAPQSESASLGLRLYDDDGHEVSENTPLTSTSGNRVNFRLPNPDLAIGTYRYTVSLQLTAASHTVFNGSYDFDIIVQENSAGFAPTVTIDEAKRTISANVGERILLPTPVVTWPQNMQEGEHCETGWMWNGDNIYVCEGALGASYALVTVPGQYAIRYMAAHGYTVAYASVTLLVKDATGNVPDNDFTLSVLTHDDAPLPNINLGSAPVGEWQALGSVRVANYAPKTGDTFDLQLVAPDGNQSVQTYLRKETETYGLLYAAYTAEQAAMEWKLQAVFNGNVVSEYPFLLMAHNGSISIAFDQPLVTVTEGSAVQPAFTATPEGMTTHWQVKDDGILHLENDVPMAGALGVTTLRVTANFGADIYADCTVIVVPQLRATLPSGLTAIESEAFMGSAFTGVIDNGSLETIGAKAFKDSALHMIVLGSNVTTIAADAFEGCTNLIFVCPTGSAAATYATDKGYVLYTID